MRPEIAFLPHVLYRFYDAEDALLYLGITVDEGVRWLVHAKTEWWPQVARVAIEKHPDRASAFVAEKAAIKAERPRYNVVHNVTRPKVRPSLDGLRERIADRPGWGGTVQNPADLATEAAEDESGELPGEVAVEVIPAPDDVAEAFEISPGVAVVRCVQVFYRDREPSRVEISYIPTHALTHRNRQHSAEHGRLDLAR